jgi:hypothetical protein
MATLYNWFHEENALLRKVVINVTEPTATVPVDFGALAEPL